MEAKVVWAEGVYLTQQYFQQFEAFHTEQYRTLSRLGRDLCWGVMQLSIDQTTLLSGILRVLQCECVFPNGLYVQFIADEAELSFKLKCHQHQFDIYLCISLNDKVSGITAYPIPSMTPTWHADYQAVTDRYDSNRQQDVLVAKPNLFLSDTPISGYQNLLIAKLTKHHDQYTIDKNFIPATMFASYQPLNLLLQQCSQVISDIDQQLYGLCQNEKKQNTSLLMLRYHTMSYQDKIQRQLNSSEHPSRIYALFWRFARGFRLLNIDAVSTQNEYHHQDINQSFSDIQQAMLSIHQQLTSFTNVCYPLTAVSRFIYHSERIDRKHLQARLRLRVPLDIDISEFHHRVKVADKSNIETIVSSSLSGVPLIKRGFNVGATQYLYEFDERHTLWPLICESQQIAIYLPEDLTHLKLDIVVDENDIH